MAQKDSRNVTKMLPSVNGIAARRQTRERNDRGNGSRTVNLLDRNTRFCYYGEAVGNRMPARYWCTARRKVDVSLCSKASK